MKILFDSLKDGRFDFETFLQSDELATRQQNSLNNVIIRTVSGSISTLFSFVILCILYRSHDRLSTTYHRLILGLCITDIMSSVCFALNSLMVPSELDYWVWRARGNMRSCNVQGFLLTIGVNSAQLYNAALCLYYLAIVRHKKTSDYIRKNIEPWLHGVSILYPLFVAIFAILKDIINPVGVICTTYNYHPPHCIGYKDGEIPDGYELPCGRGEERDFRMTLFFAAIASATTIVLIVVSMALMYSAVRTTEKKMEQYGTSALKLRIQQRNSCSSIKTNLQSASGFSDSYGDLERGVSGLLTNNKKDSFLTSLRLSATQRKQRVRLRKSTKSRAILQRALAYTLAWFLTYTPRFVVMLWSLIGGTPPSLAFSNATNFLTPLQGFFNFIVFIYPRVLEAKGSSSTDVSWWKALTMALASRKSHGSKRRRSSLPTNKNRRGQPTKRSKRVRTLEIFEEEEDGHKEDALIADILKPNKGKGIHATP